MNEINDFCVAEIRTVASQFGSVAIQADDYVLPVHPATVYQLRVFAAKEAYRTASWLRRYVRWVSCKGLITPETKCKIEDYMRETA